MSGGWFGGWSAWQLDEIAEEIESVILNNEEEDYGGYARNYTPETIAKFREAQATMRRARVMIRRIDWLLSGDDSEESFHSRWDDELKG